MSDLIDRGQALNMVIESLDDWYGGSNVRNDEIRARFATLPSAEPENRWIPRKKPPKRDGWYLVYAPTYTGGSSSGKENHNGIMFARYQTASWLIEKGYYTRPNLVRAWMELPKPPEEGSKNEV